MKYLILLIVILLLIYAYFIEPNGVKIENVVIESEKISSDFDNFKIVQISDLHIKEYGFKEEYVSKSLITIKPNLVVFTGDFIDDEKYISALEDFLKNFRNSYEGLAFAVLGNWDINSNPEKIINLLNNYNINVLINESFDLEKGNSYIEIVGVNDPITEESDLEKATFRVNFDKFTILLAHAPDIVKYFNNNYKFDLILVGHTHGGQIGIPYLAKKLSPTSTSYIRGLYETSFGKLYVNRGIGTSLIKLRFLCPPELTVITLRQHITH